MLTRLDQQLAFILELDKLKGVLRRTLLVDGTRNENTAEHSWHIAVMVPLLAEHAPPPVDVARVTKMLLVHDVIEIDAGDTYCYDPAANLDKAQRERRAADRLFGLLPPDQRDDLRALWEEFERNDTPDARFANALDRFQALLNNFHSHGRSWQQHHVTLAQVQQRMSPIAVASPTLAAHVQSLLTEAVQRGYLADEKRG